VIKRLLATMALALCVVAVSMADVKIKNLDGTNVEITFTFKDDAASQMNVIGSFDGWTVPGEPMTRNAAGLWEFVLKAKVSDEIQYKFYNNGAWIFDFKAPDKKDDGFGGNNGLIVVADLLAGAAAKSGSGAAAADPFASKLNFGMYTILGSVSNFSTQGVVDKKTKGFETDNTAVKGKAYWKIGGTLLPNVNAWFEMKAFDGVQSIWAQDSTGKVSPDAGTGIAQLIGGFLSNPVTYLGGGQPYLNSVKTGLTTPYVIWETGYGYAKPTKRTAILWETLQDQDGGNGYMRFDLGPELQKVGSGKLELTLAPNRMGGNYAFFGWADYAVGDYKVDFQYDVKSAESATLSKIFDKLYHQDFILGAAAKVAGLDLKAQGLVNLFSESTFAPETNLAGDFKAIWSLPGDKFGITAGYRYTGSAVATLYGDNDSGESDTLGDAGTQRAILNLFGKPLADLKLGVDLRLRYFVLNPTATLADELYSKPWIEANLSSLMGRKSTLNAYVKLGYLLDPNFVYVSDKAVFNAQEAGAKLSVAEPLPGTILNVDTWLGFNNSEADRTLTTLVTQIKLPKDRYAEIGLGLRLPRSYASQAIIDANNPFAFSLGGSWMLPIAEIKKPVLFGAFVWNMDPYDITNGSNDATASLNFTDYIVNGGVGKRDGKAQFRLMLKWDF